MAGKASDVNDVIAAGLGLPPTYVGWVAGALRRAGLLPQGRRGRIGKGGAEYGPKECVLLLLATVGTGAAKNAPEVAQALFDLRLCNVAITLPTRDGTKRRSGLDTPEGWEIGKAAAQMSFGECLIDTMQRGVVGPGTQVHAISVDREAEGAALVMSATHADPQSGEPVTALITFEYTYCLPVPSSDFVPMESAELTKMAAWLTAHPVMSPISADRLKITATAPASILDAMAVAIGAPDPAPGSDEASISGA